MSNDKNNDLLKYRVYDRERSEYRAPEDFVLAMSGELYEVCIFSDEGGVYFEKVEDDRYIVERCTGCRDKCNVPIYDGDVYDDHDTLWFVKRAKAFGVAPHLQPFRLEAPDHEWSYEGGMPEDTADPCFGVEVVGTIHDPVYKNGEGVKNE